MTHRKQTRTAIRRVHRIHFVGLLVAIAAIAAGLGYGLPASASSAAASSAAGRGGRAAGGGALPSSVWPAYGQAAVQVGRSQVQVGPNQHEAPIAGVAKVMTAYLVLRDHPLRAGQDGPTITR